MPGVVRPPPPVPFQKWYLHSCSWYYCMLCQGEKTCKNAAVRSLPALQSGKNDLINNACIKLMYKIKYKRSNSFPLMPYSIHSCKGDCRLSGTCINTLPYTHCSREAQITRHIHAYWSRHAWQASELTQIHLKMIFLMCSVLGVHSPL